MLRSAASFLPSFSPLSLGVAALQCGWSSSPYRHGVATLIHRWPRVVDRRPFMPRRRDYSVVGSGRSYFNPFVLPPPPPPPLASSGKASKAPRSGRLGYWPRPHHRRRLEVPDQPIPSPSSPPPHCLAGNPADDCCTDRCFFFCLSAARLLCGSATALAEDAAATLMVALARRRGCGGKQTKQPGSAAGFLRTLLDLL